MLIVSNAFAVCVMRVTAGPQTRGAGASAVHVLDAVYLGALN
jgi:hypothetical protein